MNPGYNFSSNRAALFLGVRQFFDFGKQAAFLVQHFNNLPIFEDAYIRSLLGPARYA